tara:strand:- start:1322 stop:2425 length:1104 start_codon:yes stop_codon:yes gene_type:complete
MKPIKLIINTKTQKYPIYIGANLISKLSKILDNHSIKFKKCLIIVDKNVPKRFILKVKKSIKKESYIYYFNANEKNKSQKTVNSILKTLLIKNFSRNDCLIALGGGITGDVVGFVASLYKRGLKFINIPTTLLSQVDSSVGGKTGINTEYGKNLIGSFYQPQIVIGDSDFLKSLPKREIVCGYAEILKHSLIIKKVFFKFLDKNIQKILKLRSPFIEKAIYESCKIKKSIVEKDEKEKNIRKVLNFGHTFAHAFEATLNYTNKLNHGEAVLLGMNAALSFSYQNNLLKKNDYHEFLNHVKGPNLPYNIKKYFSKKDLNKILFYMMRDKKNNTSKINLILLKKIGSPLINKEFNKNKLKSFLKNELSY